MSKHSAVDSEWDFSDPGQHPQGPYNKWWKETLGKRLIYAFIREGWDRDITEISTLEILAVEKSDPVPTRLSIEDRDVLIRIGNTGIKRLMQFLDVVESLDKAKQFSARAGITADELKSLLRKVHRYLPFGAQMRQLVDKDDSEFQGYVDQLMSKKLGHSFALLEIGRTREGRQQIAKDTGVPESAVLDLVKRSDLTRLHLMGGGMIRQCWAIGYRGLSDLRKASPNEYYSRCQEYYHRNYKGMPYDFTLEGAYSGIARMNQVPDLIEE